MNPGFVTEIFEMFSLKSLSSSSIISFAISIGDFFKSLASKSAILEERSPNSDFFGGVRE